MYEPFSPPAIQIKASVLVRWAISSSSSIWPSFPLLKDIQTSIIHQKNLIWTSWLGLKINTVLTSLEYSSKAHMRVSRVAHIFKEVKNGRDPLNCNTVMEKVNVKIGFKFLTINAWYVICRFTYVFDDKRKATGRLTEVW